MVLAFRSHLPCLSQSPQTLGAHTTYYVGYLSPQVTLPDPEDPLKLSFILSESLSHCLKIFSQRETNLLRLGEGWKDEKTQTGPSH